MLRLHLALALILVGLPAQAETLVVRPDGSGDYPTIQAAFEAASDGDTIELTDGTFCGDGNRDIDFAGKALVVRSQSGLPEACIIDCQGTEGSPHRAFLLFSEEAFEATLEGVRIQNGHQGGQFGGGVCCLGASISISNCVFAECCGGGGGALYVQDGSLVLEACVFEGNHGSQGGGALYMTEDPDQSLLVADCIFRNNQAAIGGGLDFRYDAAVTVRGCVFLTNDAYYGAGVSCDNLETVIEDCVFRENIAHQQGGGLYCSGEGTGISVTHCVFEGNQGGQGGGVVCSSTPYYASEPEFVDCTFFSNLSSQGGALLFRDSDPVLVRCTLSHNADYSDAAQLYLDATHAELLNSVITFAWEGRGVYCTDGGSAALECCDVYGNCSGDWGGCLQGQLGTNGNICVDPLYCNPDAGDFTLHENSPCAPFTPPNPDCDQIGAWPTGCGSTPVERSTWGRIKLAFGSQRSSR